MGEPTGNCNIDIQRLAADLETKLCNVDLDGGRRRSSPECLISKVKPQVRRVDDSQYTPQLVLVGAYHHKPLDSMDQLAKWTALRRVLPDDGEQRVSTLRRCLAAIAGVEDEARSYYEDRAEAIGLKLFVHMLLLDAWYVHHIFNVGGCGAQAGGEAAAAASRGGSAADYIFAVRDVVYLLENQIPFFILEKVFELVHVGNSGEDQDQQTQTCNSGDGGSGSSSSSTVVVDGFVRLVRSLLQPQCYSKVELDIATIRPCHLVHLLHMHFRPTSLTPTAAAPATGGDNTDGATARPAPATVYRWRGATQYHAAGVRFKSRPLDGDARCVLDVELRRLTLHVPT